MRFLQKRWKNDPRSAKFSHHKLFGTIRPAELPPTLDRPEGYLHNQMDTLRCTGYGSAANGECMAGVVMSPDWAAYKIGKKMGESVDTAGGDPNATMKHMRDDGFLPLNKAPFNLSRDGVDGSGFDAAWPKELDGEAALWDTVPGFVKIGDSDSRTDIFDEIRSALQKAYDPVMRLGAAVDAFGPWYDEWTHAPGGIVPTANRYFAGYHRWIFTDWVTINGVPYLKCKNSYGVKMGLRGFYLFPREVVNREFSLPNTSLKICKTLTLAQMEMARREDVYGRIQRFINDIWYALSTSPLFARIFGI